MRLLGLTAALSPEIEGAIAVWMSDLCGGDAHIPSYILSLHAKELALAVDVASTVAASWWWQRRFMAVKAEYLRLLISPTIRCLQITITTREGKTHTII